MSFEGYIEYLSVSGEYWTEDVYQASPQPRSPALREEPLYYHMVDETNGYEYGNPDTYPAETIPNGYRAIVLYQKMNMNVPIHKPKPGSDWKSCQKDIDIPDLM